MPNQPTILVKKKDGTSERMTMEEFKLYKNGSKNIANGQSPTNNTNIPKPPIASPVVKIKRSKDQKINDKTKIWTKDDHKSPLDVGEVKEARKQEVVKTVLPESRGDAYDQVMRNLKFPVADELWPRLKSLIVSRVKDIRSDEQVIEYATRAVANGGLGLTEAQAGELVVVVKVNMMHDADSTMQKSSKFEVRSPSGQNQKTIEQLNNRTIEQGVTSYQLPEHRPIMHDVIAPTVPSEEVKASVGPIEELQQITLIDFRRLSANPAQASDILLEKFEGLKKESYLLFIKAVQAWYNSPLYKQYQQIIADAINKTVKIKDALGQMKEEEYKAIVKLCNNL